MFGRLKNWLNKPPVPRLLRYLRIAFSAICGILCLLMIAWWVRSYWWADDAFLKLTPSEYVQVHDGDGRMCIWFEHKPIKGWFDLSSDPIAVHTLPDADNRVPWLDVHSWPTFTRVYTAHWFLTVIAGAFAVLPWCPRRFSLRGLLIAMTIMAVISGAIVWMDKNF
jgi:hypothetical protein